jgi:two-component system, NtrC family, sensor kinase
MAESYEQLSREALLAELGRLRGQVDQLTQSDAKRRRAEQRLDDSERRYQTLSQNIALGLYRRIAGVGGKLVMVNAAMVQLFRYESEDDILGTPITDLYWDPTECVDFSAKMLQDRQVIRQELKMRCKDGTPIWGAVTATVIYGDDHTPAYFDGIMEDITERKQIEAEKRMQQKQLMQADKMITLGILVSGVAHEINNPNQFIVSNLSPLKRCMDDALPILERYYAEQGDFMLGGRRYSQRKQQIPDMFANIAKGSARIKNIVTELRDYARENPTDVTETIHINSVVESALALLANLIKKSTQQFSTRYGEAMPPIKGDYQRIEQVLINLIQNACQALADMQGTLSVNTYFQADTQQVCVEVSDAGIGISPEDLKHILDPFFTTKRSKGGTGLGLSISAAIVEKHQGSLGFESQVGKGTTALLRLPAFIEETL